MHFGKFGARRAHPVSIFLSFSIAFLLLARTVQFRSGKLLLAMSTRNNLTIDVESASQNKVQEVRLTVNACVIYVCLCICVSYVLRTGVKLIDTLVVTWNPFFSFNLYRFHLHSAFTCSCSVHLIPLRKELSLSTCCVC